jgi:Tol biopolymer transport system component
MSIVPFVGGKSQRVRPDFDAARFPIWTPDGKHLLFEGNPDRTPMGQWAPTEDWWVTPLEGGPAVQTGAFKAFRESGVFDFSAARELSPFVPSAWSADGSRVIFPAKMGDSWNLWQIPISGETWHVRGDPVRLTKGTGLEAFPSVSVTGQVVFSSLVSNVDIWSLPVDANRGRPTGKLRNLTQNAAYDAAFDVSDDGSKLVFLSNRSGNLDVWLRDLHTGRERQLTVTPADESWPKMAPDGSRISYESKLEGGRRQSIWVMPVTGGIPEMVCEDCAGPYDWSADGQSFLYRMVVRPTTVGWMHLATGKKVVFLSYPESPVFSPYFSPDYSWISFGARIKPKLSQLFIARFRGATPPSVSEWITVSDGSAHDYPSRWSPDGNLLYFVSTRDRFVCLWAQQLDPATKHPLGTAFEVYASHHSVLSLSSVDGTSREFCVTRDQILLNLGELTGNIWMITSN